MSWFIEFSFERNLSDSRVRESKIVDELSHKLLVSSSVQLATGQQVATWPTLSLSDDASESRSLNLYANSHT